MHPSEFCQLAGFPEPWQEKHLQEYLANRLEQLGFAAQRERSANGGFADIVTNWNGATIIEVKKYLDRNTIYQAAGQLGLYGQNNQHNLVVMGFLTTKSAEEQKSAFSTASMIQQNPRFKVIFVNLVQEWHPDYKIRVSRLWFKIPSLALSFPSFTSVSLPKFDCKQCFDLVKAHPLLCVLAIVLLISTLPNLQSNNNELKQTGSTSTRAK
nr:hypothetical protein [Nostoc sp. EkiNYC01]